MKTQTSDKYPPGGFQPGDQVVYKNGADEAIGIVRSVKAGIAQIIDPADCKLEKSYAISKSTDHLRLLVRPTQATAQKQTQTAATHIKQLTYDSHGIILANRSRFLGTLAEATPEDLEYICATINSAPALVEALNKIELIAMEPIDEMDAESVLERIIHAARAALRSAGIQD